MVCDPIDHPTEPLAGLFRVGEEQSVQLRDEGTYNI